MEAFTALSVASSVIQFVDFGSKLLSRSRQLYKSADGVLSENVDVELLIKDLLILTQGLRRQLRENRPLQSPAYAHHYSDDDEALDMLCRRSVEIAEELLRRLSKLEVKDKETKDKEPKEKDKVEYQPDLTHTITEEGRRRLKFGVKFDGSEAAERSKLKLFRNGALKELALQQTQTSHQLAQSTRLILDSFLRTRDELATQLQLQAEKLIEITVNEGAQRIHDSNRKENILRGELEPIGMLQTAKNQPTPDIQDTEVFVRAAQVEEEIRILMIEHGILGSLSFSTLMDRLDSVEIAYSQTFEWIYQEPQVLMKPWSNFVNWLRHGSGIYWINGKAGSGKSTLMRYIYENEKTRSELQEWAGSTPAEISGFFFWNSGDPEQRSQSGLLRSLLFEILQRHRDLLHEVSPDVWDAWSARASCIVSSKLPLSSPLLPPEPKTWTLVQLKRAFRTLLQKISISGKLFLLIDGLDEYEGDYEEIIELFQEFAISPNIKLCLSSRPLIVFERAFSELPSLKLQNLTYGDISHYVKHKLGSHRYMIQLSQQHSVQVSHLINEIVEKASGVFLWIKLVVKSLLHGLRDFNRISDLQKRVRHLPADLEALYAHMLGHTDPFYHEQASQIFQIVRAAQKRSGDKVTLLNLSWAEDEDEKLAENAPIRHIEQEEVLRRCQTMDARLKSVCAGLLESNDDQFLSIAPDLKVSFLHRTVSDFFKKPEVWREVLAHTVGKGFSPNLCMLKSCVLQLKTFETSNNNPLDMNIISNALGYAKEAEEDLNCGFPKLLDQLDIAASCLWRMSSTEWFHSADKTDTGSMIGSVGSSSSEYLQMDRNVSFKYEGINGSDSGDSDATVGDSESSDAEPSEVPTYFRHSSGWNEETIGNPDFETDIFGYTGLSKPPSDDLFVESESLEKQRTIVPSKYYSVDRVCIARSSTSKTGPNRLRNKKAFKPLKSKALAIKTNANKRTAESKLSHHWSYGLELPDIKSVGVESTFYNLARDLSLNHYVAMKIESGIIVDQDVNQHQLRHIIPIAWDKPGAKRTVPNPAVVDRLLDEGANPNISYDDATPWEDAMVSAISHFISRNDIFGMATSIPDAEWEETAQAWAKILQIFVKHGADPNARTKKQHNLPGHPRLSPLLIVRQYFPRTLSAAAAELDAMLVERGGQLEFTQKHDGIKTTVTKIPERINVSSTRISWLLSWFRL